MRRWAKWAGLTACIFLAAMWVVSVFSVSWVAVRRQGGFHVRVALATGCVYLHTRSQLRYERPPPLITARMAGRDVTFPMIVVAGL